MPSSSRVTCERRISATEGDEQEDIGGLHVTVLRDTTPFVGVIGAQAPHVVRSGWSSAIPAPRRMPRRSEAEPRCTKMTVNAFGKRSPPEPEVALPDFSPVQPSLRT